MIAKTQQYKKKKYGGWGLDPVTWQAYVYILVLVVVEILILTSQLSKQLKFGLILSITAFSAVDLFIVYKKLKSDEREIQIQQIAEKNASFAMVTVLIIGIMYNVLKMIETQIFYIDPFIILALLAGLIVKGLIFYKLEK